MAVETQTQDSAIVSEELSLPSQLDNLSKLLGERPEALATGSDELRKAALAATKFIYDLGMTTSSTTHIIASLTRQFTQLSLLRRKRVVK